jgi:hypothetical protein
MSRAEQAEPEQTGPGYEMSWPSFKATAAGWQAR